MADDDPVIDGGGDACSATWAGTIKMGGGYGLLVEAPIDPDGSLEDALTAQQTASLPTRGRWSVSADPATAHGFALLEGFVPRGDDTPDIRVSVVLDLPAHAKALWIAAHCDANALVIRDAKGGDLSVPEAGSESIEIADLDWGPVLIALSPARQARAF